MESERERTFAAERTWKELWKGRELSQAPPFEAILLTPPHELQSMRSLRVGTRAQSDLMGTILVLAIAIAGTTALLAVGADVLASAQQSAQVGSASQAMQKLDAVASLVANGPAEQRSATVSLRGISESLTVKESAGWMNISVYNQTTGDFKYELMNVTLGAVLYNNGQTTIAYQGGGVWKKTPTGTTMISPPEVHYRGQTLTLPLVTVNGKGGVGGDLKIKEKTPGRAIFPNESEGLHNPLENGEVVIKLHSEYYSAWGRFFEVRTGADVSVDDENETVTITLVTPSDRQSVQNALAATSPSG
ncbi:MAG: hypothetical protein ABEI52_08605, partial [Halobacteriaceae archaeon]